MAAAWTVQKFLAVAPGGVLSQALSDGQLKRVAREVLERCDAADGLKDGLVQDPACRINLQGLQCPGAGADCLQPAQTQALAEVMAGPRNSQGALYFG